MASTAISAAAHFSLSLVLQPISSPRHHKVSGSPYPATQSQSRVPFRVRFSFFPPLSTSLVQSFIMFGISFVLGIGLFALVKATQVVLGFQVPYSSPYFIALVLVYALVVVFITFYLIVNWTLANAVVVVESSWGAEPLKRSRNLVKGMKKVALKLLLFFAFVSSINTWRSMVTPGESAADYKSKSWLFVLGIVVISCLHVVIMLYSLAANTVFYIYSKAQHGEIAEGFVGEYASLPFDDDIGKAPLVVSICIGKKMSS